MPDSHSEPRLYYEFADWFHLLTAPEEYAEEAAFYMGVFEHVLGRSPISLLELGAGGGNMASHYKKKVRATLTDISPAMLQQSKAINPECEHVVGDMRTLRLGTQFEAVFVHDAVCYLTSHDDLKQAFSTAYIHCAPGGAAIFAPDHTRENFAAMTEHGGHDGQNRSLRYLEWTSDPDPDDCTYLYEFAYLMHERGRPTRVELDSHVCGLFSEREWLEGLAIAGFDQVIKLPGVDAPWEHVIFVARRKR